MPSKQTIPHCYAMYMYFIFIECAKAHYKPTKVLILAKICSLEVRGKPDEVWSSTGTDVGMWAKVNTLSSPSTNSYIIEKMKH